MPTVPDGGKQKRTPTIPWKITMIKSLKTAMFQDDRKNSTQLKHMRKEQQKEGERGEMRVGGGYFINGVDPRMI